MGWLDLVKCGRFGALLEKTLENEIANRPNRNEICDEIAACYTGLLRLLHVECCTSFRFPDYEDCRRVIVDGTEYDFDIEFHHGHRSATEMLCALDCLLSDLGESKMESKLKMIEQIMNTDQKKRTFVR